MRNTLPLSLAAWATAALTAFSFAACAKAVNGDLSDVPDGGFAAANGDSGAGTQQSNGEVDAGPTIGSFVDAAGNGSGDDGSSSSGDDSGSPQGDDSGSGTTDSGSSSGGQDSAPPPTLDVCPDDSTHSGEYLNLNLFTLTNCSTNTDCSSSDCCYAGSQVVSFVGPACVKK